MTTSCTRRVLLAVALIMGSALAFAQEVGYADELMDFGVIPSNAPRSRAQGYGAPTPTSIPGAKVITTRELMEMQSANPKPAIFVVYSAKGVIPGAISANGAGEDRLFGLELEKFTKLLAKSTNGDKSLPVVFYCHGPKCWLSYNAALHAKEAGYSNIYWYRGGRDAWKAAGLKFKKPQTDDSSESEE
ncbi:MAG: rhodanese-like domain-containing protein [Comamonas sp.]